MLTILTGDAIEQLRALPSESVHCCVTSPPYWGLRDYGTAQWEGGSNDCTHEPPQEWIDHNFNARSAFGNGAATQSAAAKGRWYSSAGGCPACGARPIDSQLGIEKTPEEYVAKMVEVFREVRRVLRKDGTLWLNLGDSYAANEKGSGNRSEYDENYRNSKSHTNRGNEGYRFRVEHGLKPKDLCGIPWRVAFALQADGWWLRSDIIWHKPNPMPESVTDRPTKAHEYLFLLTKSANYFYDAEAIKEKAEPATLERSKYNWCSPDTKAAGYQELNGLNRNGEYPCSGNRNKRSVWTVEDNLALARWLAENETETWQRFRQESRNKKDVWTVATAPYPEAHFATYPPDLIKPCILAGTSAKGCCAKCGSPWERVVERQSGFTNGMCNGCGQMESKHIQSDKSNMISRRGETVPCGSQKTIGWQPTCECYGDEQLHQTFVREIRLNPCTILDPFAGSGTTGAVAIELGRKAILIELNPKYIELIRQRCDITPGLQLA